MNLDSNKDSSTKIRLILTAQELFAKLGYEVTTTRMIANKAGVAQSAISFHFGTKENLCKSVFDYTAQLINEAYYSLCHKIDEDYNSGSMTKELAWGYIDKIISKQIRYSFDSRNQNIINIVLREDTFPPQLFGILSHTIFDKIEGQLARLLITISSRDEPFWALVISRAINGAIFTFCEQPILLQNVLHTKVFSKEQKDLMEDYVHDYLLGGIKAFVRGNGFSTEA